MKKYFYQFLNNKKTLINTFAFEAYTIFILCIIIISALNTSNTIDFYPINGTFQNYNPIRRLLSGQVPFIDFYDYLGLGHLYIGALLTCIFGGDFHASLVAFDVISLLSYTLILFLIGKAILNNKLTSIKITILIVGFFAINTVIFSDKHFAGNSARLIRGMILPIICTLWFFKDYLILKSNILQEYKNYFQITFWGIISGFSFLWSNDYGISAWFCILFFMFLLVSLKKRNPLWGILGSLISLLISLIVIYCCVYLLTNGNIIIWYNQMFGSGGFQAWYYNSTKSYFIWNIDFTKVIILQYCVSLLYFIVIICKSPKETINNARYIIPFFANFTSSCAVNEYRLLSGGYNHEIAYIVLAATIIYETFNILSNYLKPNAVKLYNIITLLLSILCIIVLTITYYQTNTASTNSTYFKSLGGYMTKLNNDIINANKFINGAKFFSTYASAQEVISNTFQPSGTDYIIHVLGNDARNNYLKSFKSNDFDYVATIKSSFTDWEYWVVRANWFFYRELYSNWHPVYANQYELYWGKNSKNDNVVYEDIIPIVEDIEQEELHLKKIIINLDKNISGTADVYIDYNIEDKSNFKSKIFSKFIIRKLLEVKNTGFNFANNQDMDKNYLPSSGKEHIPITIVNGYGEVSLYSYPDNYTNLIINQVKCNKIFTTDFNYLEINTIKNINNELFLVAKNSWKNKYILADAKQIKISNKIYKIKNIKQNYNSYLINIAEDESKITDLQTVINKNNYAYILKGNNNNE